MFSYAGRGVKFDSFETLDSWTFVSGNSGSRWDSSTDGSLAGIGPGGVDVTALRPDHTNGGTQGRYRIQSSTKRTIAAQGSHSAGETSAVFCQGPLALRIKTDTPEHVQLYIALWRESFSSSGYYESVIPLDASNTIANSYEDGWQLITVSPADLGVFGGAPAWGEGQYIEQIYIGAYVKSSAPTAVYELQLSDFYLDVSKGPVPFMWTHDDGNDTDLSVAAPILTAQNLRSTAYVIPSLVDVNPSYLTSAEIQTLQNTYGWQGAGHHETNLTTLTGPALTTVVDQCASDLRALSLNGWRDFAYPLGGFNKEVIDALQSAGFISGRTLVPRVPMSPSDPEFTAQRLFRLPGVGTSDFGSGSVGAGFAGDELDEFIGMMDANERYGLIGSVFTHAIFSMAVKNANHTDVDLYTQYAEAVGHYKTMGRIVDMTASELRAAMGNTGAAQGSGGLTSPIAGGIVD